MHLDVVDLKKKRAEERAKESQSVKKKNYEDYAWKDLCEDSTKLKNTLSARATQTSQTQ